MYLRHLDYLVGTASDDEHPLRVTAVLVPDPSNGGEGLGSKFAVVGEALEAADLFPDIFTPEFFTRSMPVTFGCSGVPVKCSYACEKGSGRPKGRKSMKTKLTGQEKKIKDLLDKKVSYSAIARILGVHRLTVSSFVNHRLVVDDGL